MNPIRVSNVRHSFGSEAEVSARIEGLSASGKNELLWFRFPLGMLSTLHLGGEPFVAALLPMAMSLGRSLAVDAPVSRQFLEGCRQIISLYSAWDRRLRKIELQAPVAPDSRATGFATGCFFTGGVDSFYSLLKNLDRESGAQRVTHLIFVRGYASCPLDNQPLYDRLSSKLQKVACAVGLHFLPVSTNFKSLTPSPAAGWDWYASSQLVAPALCLAPMFRRVIIPAGDTYSTLSPWGSHPLIDPLWSTESTRFDHDGCEASRSQKLERYPAQSKLALENLRVCDYETSGVQNCGTCEKCLRTLIGLRALHIQPPAGPFAEPIDLARVSRLDGGNKVIGYYLRDNLALARRNGGDPELEAALTQALSRNPIRWASRHARTWLQEFDRRLLGGRIRSWALSEAASNGEDSALRAAPISWAVSRLLKS